MWSDALIGFTWVSRFLVGYKRIVKNLFKFFWNRTHARNFFFRFVTCLYFIEIWGISESSSILDKTELCFSLCLWLVIVQLEVKVYSGLGRLECIWIEITLTNNKHILFGHFYRPSNADAAYLNLIEDSLGLAVDTKIIELFVTGTSLTIRHTAGRSTLYAKVIDEPTHFTFYLSLILEAYSWLVLNTFSMTSTYITYKEMKTSVQKTKNADNHWFKFRHIRNNTIKLIQESKTSYYYKLSNKLKTNSHSTKDWFSTLKSFISPSSHHSIFWYK